MPWNRLLVGTRLGIGFSTVLLLLAAVVAVSILNIHAMVGATRQMMTVSLAKERMTEEWFRSVSVGIRRTTAIIKSSDDLEPLFADEIRQTTARGTQLLEQIRSLPGNAEEERLVAEILVTRQAYVASRDAALAARRAGRAAEAGQRFAHDFLPASARLTTAIQALLDAQHAAIDAAAEAIDAAAEAIEADGARSARSAAALGLFALLLAAVLARTLARSITGPIAQARRLAEAIRLGDLSHHVDVQGRDEIAGLIRALQAMTLGLRRIVGDVRVSSDSIGQASSEIAQGNEDLSQRTERAAANLQRTASSMEQLTGTVGSSADSARRAKALVSSAADIATRGGQAMSRVVTTMDAISASATRIVDIIAVIDGLAFQTNLLALNAAVEAARAGTQGRGFAVVAGQVRLLAQRSADAAREIRALIGASVDSVATGTRLVSDAGETMREIVDSVHGVSDMISGISSAAVQQSAGLGDINSSVGQLDQMTQQNAALVEQSAAAAASLREQTRRLAAAVGTFKLS